MIVRYSKGAVTRSVISGWDIWDIWDRGPQPVIRFMTGHNYHAFKEIKLTARWRTPARRNLTHQDEKWYPMVAGDMITIDRLVSV